MTGVSRPITTTTVSTASAERVDALLKDPATWPLWSPHVASVDGPPGPIDVGWSGAVRAFFSPVATTMEVTWAEPGRGMRWTTRAYGHLLAYDNLVETEGDGCRLTWTATLTGRFASAVLPFAGPLSARGQRRRTTRLARLAEMVDRAPGSDT
jgi:hypothetical protein